jgi:transposase-like protein
MLKAVRRGKSMRKVAKQFGVTLRTVQKWVAHAGDRRLDRVDFSDRPPGRREPVNKTSKDWEDLILTVRRELKERSALGEFGADAIHGELTRRRRRGIPSVRTIGRVLDRRGALDGRKRTRRPPPPPGWYLPKLARRRVELDSFDIVEGLVIQGGYGVEVLNGISLHGGLVASWPRAKITAKTVLDALVEHWRQFGLPDYAQFDNDTVFQGPHAHPDTVGRVSRLCLSLGITVVFTPPRETGFQAAIESYNGRWQAKVWNRFRFESRRQLLSQSNKYVTAARRRAAARIDAAPARRPFPEPSTLNLQDVSRGTLIYLRRTNDQGQASLLGHTFPVDPNWPHRLVRAEVQLQHRCILFYALRRRDPNYQPLLNKVPYQLPKRPFKE